MNRNKIRSLNNRKEGNKLQKKKKGTLESAIEEKIEYLGLNFERVPKALIATDNLNFKALKGYDEKQYKQYKYVKISDIDILLTPTHRMDSLHERYDEASPLYMYLDSINEENALKYTTFLKMLKKVEIGDIEKIKEEQEKLAKEIPFKVKFNGNYLWQIYYSEYSNRYFMLVPTEDSDYSTFFYLLKKKIENKKNDMIFVPISYLEYSGQFLKVSDLKDLENYLWLFTKDYPSIYEVYDKKQNMSLQIVGETKIYGRIRTLYKMNFETAKDATKFFKLLKALFILQIGLPHYYNFTTSINDNGELELYLNDQQIRYENLLEFVAAQYKSSIELKNNTEVEIDELKEKLEKLKNKNLKKKIENATMYINEINKHKKSIFEFWKYSNKDEVAALEEGEEEELNVSKIEKVFNFDEDFEAFGEKADKNQRLKFTDSELDSSFIASTELITAINDIYNKKYVELQEYNEMLDKIKNEDGNQIIEENVDFDIFGNEESDGRKERTLGSKTHRETPRNKIKVLEINKETKGQDLKEKLGEISRNIKKALKKNTLDEDIYVYKASDKKSTFDGLEAFSLNEEKELTQTMLTSSKKDIYLYKIKLSKGTNFIAFSNIVLYNNKNMTLPVGMTESNRILIDSKEIESTPTEVKKINVEYLKNNKDDFSDIIMKKINIYEV